MTSCAKLNQRSMLRVHLEYRGRTVRPRHGKFKVWNCLSKNLLICCKKKRVRVMVFNATFNNISFISWRSALLVEETQSTQRTTCCKSPTNFIIYCCIEDTLPWTRFELKTSVVIGTDCTCSCKSNYHTITITTVPSFSHGQFKDKHLHFSCC